MLRWIDDHIVGLIDLCETTNLHEIYSCLDIKIIHLDKGNILLQDNDAFYYRDYLGMEVVFIINNLDNKYKKFILAHELGHAILHTDIYNAAFNKKLLNKGKLERQANYFALKLLDIKIDSIDFKDLTLEQIAKALHIPYKCLSNIIT